jgi:outer membrane lipoprotein LolB
MHRRAALLGLLALAGCVAAPPVAGPVLGDAARRQALAGLRRFRLSGRLAVAAGAEGFNAALEWQQSGDDIDLQLRAPLGFGSARLELRDGLWRFTTSQGLRHEGEAARQALQQQLGFELPLEALRYWVLALELPASLQAGLETWRAQVDSWREATLGRDRLQMPRRLTVQRADLRLRLLVESWQLGVPH